MPDIFDANGLQVKTRNEIVDDLNAAFRTIYGTDINVDQNSPDGQLIGILAQAAVDLREMLVAVNAGFDPDRAPGVILDERVTINNIARKGGTYTMQPIRLVTDRTVLLQGLDSMFNDPNGVGYTVQDDAGNKFILIDSITLTAGTNDLTFRAQQIGRVETTVNTITTPVTIVLGVTSINNPSGALEIGQNEETQPELRIRRQRSVANGSAGYLNGLEGVIFGIDGVTDVKVYENYSDDTDADGIPPHCIWVIVEGGANSDIALAIYGRKSYGCDMLGAVSVNIVTPNGKIFIAKFDRPAAENLYIRYDIQPTIGSAVFDTALLKQYLVDNLEYKIGQFAVTNTITAFATASIDAYGGGGAPVNLEISKDGVTYTDYLETSFLKNQFVLDVTRIAITVL